jgi:hypothetical protein
MAAFPVDRNPLDSVPAAPANGFPPALAAFQSSPGGSKKPSLQSRVSKSPKSAKFLTLLLPAAFRRPIRSSRLLQAPTAAADNSRGRRSADRLLSPRRLTPPPLLTAAAISRLPAGHNHPPTLSHLLSITFPVHSTFSRAKPMQSLQPSATVCSTAMVKAAGEEVRDGRCVAKPNTTHSFIHFRQKYS